jgi:Caudovirus prohead serine protease
LRDGAAVRALVNHATAKVIGRTKAGTLTLRKDARGLRVAIDPPNTSVARDVIESIQRRDITGMSFGFSVLADEWRMDHGLPIRYLTDMQIAKSRSSRGLPTRARMWRWRSDRFSASSRRSGRRSTGWKNGTEHRSRRVDTRAAASGGP